MSEIETLRAEVERLTNENGSLRHNALVAKLSHEQLNRYIGLFDAAGFKGHNIEVQVKLASDAVKSFREALKKIAAYDDAAASAYLRATGSYGHFDEPKSVEIARTALEGK